MFIPLLTAKGEKVFLNADKIMFIAETKKCCTVVLDDGTIIEINESYEDILSKFMPC